MVESIQTDSTNNSGTNNVTQNVVNEDLPQLLDSRGGSYVINFPPFDVGDFTSWKDRFLVYLNNIEPNLLVILENGPYVPKSLASTPENILIKPQKQWSHDDRRLANQDKRLKTIIISCLPNDVMKSVIKCATAKSMWDDLILSHEGPSNIRDTKIVALRLKFNDFKALKGDLDNSTSNVLIPLDSWTSGLLVYKLPLSEQIFPTGGSNCKENGGNQQFSNEPDENPLSKNRLCVLRTLIDEVSSSLFAEMKEQIEPIRKKIKKVNEKVYAAQVGCKQCKGPHYTKDCPLKEEGKTLEEAYYMQFGGPFQGGRYRATAMGILGGRRSGSNAKTMEQYMIKTRTDYGSGVARPKIEEKDSFELKGQFLKEL
ncbi:retrovirus-related pol polyprotein from transposon TNT 1-94 [Tanacetum coccineum]